LEQHEIGDIPLRIRRTGHAISGDYNERTAFSHKVVLQMNHNRKRIIGATGAILIGFFLWPDSDPTEEAVPTASISEKPAPKKSTRRARKGPRKPPPAAMSPAVKADEPTEEEADDNDGLTEQELKLEEYLEHVEAIEDPNVDELTMLGEMAFEANEAQAAYDHYLEVIDKHTDDPKAAFALYKLAWTEYNLGDVEAAIEDMELVTEWIGDGDSQLEEILRTSAPTDLEMFKGQAD